MQYAIQYLAIKVQSQATICHLYSPNVLLLESDLHPAAIVYPPPVASLSILPGLEFKYAFLYSVPVGRFMSAWPPVTWRALFERAVDGNGKGW